jgi:hypothetical protein
MEPGLIPVPLLFTGREAWDFPIHAIFLGGEIPRIPPFSLTIPSASWYYSLAKNQPLAGFVCLNTRRSYKRY